MRSAPRGPLIIGAEEGRMEMVLNLLFLEAVAAYHWSAVYYLLLFVSLSTFTFTSPAHG